MNAFMQYMLAIGLGALCMAGYGMYIDSPWLAMSTAFVAFLCGLAVLLAGMASRMLAGAPTEADVYEKFRRKE